MGRSELIIVGRVLSSHSHRDEYVSPNLTNAATTSYPSRIFTTYKIAVSELIKGAFDQQLIEVSRFGGFVDEIGEEGSGSYYLEPNDLVLIFLKWNEPNQKWFSVSHGTTVFRVDVEVNVQLLRPMENFHVLLTPAERERPRTGRVLNLETLNDVRKVSAQ